MPSSLPRYPQDPAGLVAVVYHLPQSDSGLSAEWIEAQQCELASLAKLGWKSFAFSLLLFFAGVVCFFVDLSLVMPISIVFVVFLCAQSFVFLVVRKWVVHSVERQWAGS